MELIDKKKIIIALVKNATSERNNKSIATVRLFLI